MNSTLGQTFSESWCSASVMPATSQTVTDFSTCSSSWSAGSWGGWDSTCSGAANRSRAVTCTRAGDGATMSDSVCAAAVAKPATSDTAANYMTCAISWSVGGWSVDSQTCGSRSETRSVTCLNSTLGQTFSESWCSASVKPATTQTVTDFSSCSSSWSIGSWSGWDSTCSAAATRSRAVTCIRSGDGAVISDSVCAAAAPKPATSDTAANYTTCSFNWSVGGWSVASQTCGIRSESRSVTCLNSTLGQTLSEDWCNGSAKPSTTQTVTDYSSCLSSWSTGTWGGWSSTCSDSSTRSRSVTCVRTGDGAIVADGICSAAALKPVTSETAGLYSSCNVNWLAGEFSTPSGCGAVTSTRSVGCYNHSLGRYESDGSCNSATRPASSQAATNYASCTYAANVGAWGAWNDTCSSSATRSRDVFCQRSDGANVSPGQDAQCAPMPASSETTDVRTGCSYSYIIDSWSTSACAGGVQTSTPSYRCQRSQDGATVANWLCTGIVPQATTQSCSSCGPCSAAQMSSPVLGTWTTTAGEFPPGGSETAWCNSIPSAVCYERTDQQITYENGNSYPVTVLVAR